MSLTSLSLGRWVLVLAGLTAAGSVVEVSIHPAPGILVTPLIVSAIALVIAFRVHLRNQADLLKHHLQLQQASELQLATIEALALAIDARDRSSQSQLRRELVHAGALAEAFGLSAEEVEGVRTAALLHDIGKLAVPDHILTKRGPLTDDERTKMRVHAEIGAEIIVNVPFPFPVASLVRSHHERWDGTGYPAGLRGSEIPIGARILAVVDYFAAITSDRAFNRAMPTAEAINVLWHEAGRALDPAVVARFLELLPTLPSCSLQRDVRPAAQLEEEGRGGADGASGVRGPTDVLDDIALANRELFALYELAETMGTSLGVSDSMAVFASKLANVVPFSTCALFLHNPTERIATCRFATGAGAAAFRPLTLPEGQGLVWKAIARRECVLSANGAADSGVAGAVVESEGLHSALVCPLVLSDTVIGVLALYHTAPAFYTDDHRRLAMRISEQAAAVIYNSLVFEQTQEASVTDALTGLPNTRFLFPHLSRELARASRLNSPMALLVLDLDNLKNLNDTFGHNAGDRALCAVASVLRNAIRPYDICVRYGGDEFIVLLSDCGADQADAKRLELQKGVESLPFSVGEMLRTRLSISVGVAVFPEDGDSYDVLLGVADSRMYRDKAERKRRAAQAPSTSAL
jgi:diguanylate cyclase (GGDEF)-like protein/putative nucleotidyltransferase with HDIG domain